MDGCHHGITISLKTGLDIYTVVEDARRKLGIGEELDILQAIYGRVFSKTSPWAGKNFKKIDQKRLDELTEGFKDSKEMACIGINSFRKENKNIVNKLSNYLFSPKPDILGSIQRQDVTIDGNLNYLYKFAYMAKHLQLMVTGGA